MSIGTLWYRDVNQFARDTPWLHTVLASYALWGGLVALVLLLVVGWLRARRGPDAPRKVATALLTGLAAVVAILVNQHLLSPLVARTRPCHALAHVEVLLPCATDYSFPSDHAIIAGAFVVGLWLVDRRLGIIAAALALLLAFARVYVGVHYPGDVAGGLLIGGLISFLVVTVLLPLATLLAIRLMGTALRRLVSAGG